MLAKFSMEGPKTGTLPKAAGSRILWPPESTSEPPTKTPSARRYREASSPMESSNRTVTSSEMPWWLGFALGEMPGPGRDNWERRMNLVGFFDEIGGGSETFGLARSEDEEGFGKIALHYAED